MTSRAAACLAIVLALGPTLAGAVPRTLTHVGDASIPHLEAASAVVVSPDGVHVYVAAQGEGAVTLFERDAGTGELAFVAAVQEGVGGVDGITGATSIAISPDGAHVYVTGSPEDAVALFTRNGGTGVLTFVSTVRDGLGGADGLAGAASVAVSPDGAHVYVAARGEDAIAVFSRNGGTGALTFVEAERDGVAGVDGLDGATSVVVSPDGAHVYATGFEDDAVAVFARDGGTGALTFVEVQRDGVGGVNGLFGANAVALSGDGAHVYVAARYEGIEVFSRNAGTGALTFVQSPPGGGTYGYGHLTSIAVSPDGAHVYSASTFENGAGEHVVEVFSRDAGTGFLTFVEEHEHGVGGVDGLSGASSVVVSADGAQVYVAAALDDAVAAFDRNGVSGALTFIESEEINRARGLTVTPDGAHAYAVANDFDDQRTLTIFARDPGTGLLTFLTGQPNPAGSQGDNFALAVSPDGLNVYSVASFGSQPPSAGSITAFSRNVGTGALTFLEAEVDGAGGVDGLDGAVALAISADGAHVYVVGVMDDAVAVFSRDPGTGALTFVEAEFDGVGGVDGLDGANSVAISPDGAHVYVSGYYDGKVAIFTRNVVTGVLTFSETFDGVQVGNGGVAISPDGAFVYVGTVPLSRNAGTGALAYVDDPDDGSDASHIIVISPDGEAVYRWGGFPVLSRDVATGRLVLVEVQPGIEVAISADGAHVYGVQSDGRDIRTYTPGYAGCDPAPLAGCRTAVGGSVRIRADGTVYWSWNRGQATTGVEFGAPSSQRTHYALCVYDESGLPALVARRLAAWRGNWGGGPPFSPAFRLRDPDWTPEGVVAMVLKPGGDDQSKVVVRGKDRNVPPVALPLGLPVRVQLQASNGNCWDATYSAPAGNTSSRFRARAD
jgi:6-phosphogluconolactonase (cycloisomerase 2 family)